MSKTAGAFLVSLGLAIVVSSCNKQSAPLRPSSVRPSASTAAPIADHFSGSSLDAGASPGALSSVNGLDFPGREGPFAFRVLLEEKYRQRGALPESTYVDLEGDIVWVSEYLRYRVNGCDHGMASQKVFDQIEGRGIQPVCQNFTGTGEIPFPPRNEPQAFRFALDDWYRLRGFPFRQSIVNIEGTIVWVPDYLRYRLNNCDHFQASQKVFTEIDTGVRPPTLCGPPPPPPPAPPERPVASFEFVSNDPLANRGQCTVAVDNNLGKNVIKCTFDARNSRPRPGISAYEWTFFTGSPNPTIFRNQEVLVNPAVNCGTFDVASFEEVRLIVRSPGGEDEERKTITFIKGVLC